MKGIIPTGGRGTRMRPVTFSANKHFIPVGNKPLIFYPIEALADAGIKEVAITYNSGQLDFVKKFLGTGSKWGLKFTYILQPDPQGLAHVVRVCEDYLAGSPFVYHLGDNIFTKGIKDLVEYFMSSKPNGLLSVIHHPENTRMGVPYFNKKGKLIKYVEKPTNPPHDLAIPGLYFADNNFFKSFRGSDAVKPSARGEYEIPDPFQWMIDHDFRVETFEVKGKWLDPGKFDDWIETNRYLLDINTPETTIKKLDNSRIEGRVVIGENCVITNSHIRGPVNISNGVVVTNSFIGPFTSIDKSCIIENCHIENSVLMSGIKLENIEKPIDNSLIGPDTHISGHSNLHGRTQFFIGELNRIRL